MRLSITGSHSTGKTSLCSAAVRHFDTLGMKGVGVIHEVARQVIGRGFPLNKSATVNSYINYIWLQLRAERAQVSAQVISDRSMVDLLAYVRTNDDKRIPVYFVSMLEELLWLESRYFDVYCYLPIEFPLVCDNVRPIDVVYQRAVDDAIREIFAEYSLAYRALSGSLDERVNQLVQLLAPASAPER
jgi:nicotinamide riboside kinase